ncbi:hypothetical protein GQ457_06G024710 [Hibiscus cannabinus]
MGVLFFVYAISPLIETANAGTALKANARGLSGVTRVFSSTTVLSFPSKLGLQKLRHSDRNKQLGFLMYGEQVSGKARSITSGYSGLWVVLPYGSSYATFSDNVDKVVVTHSIYGDENRKMADDPDKDHLTAGSFLITFGLAHGLVRFIANVQRTQNLRARYNKAGEIEGAHTIRKATRQFPEMDGQHPCNTQSWTHFKLKGYPELYESAHSFRLISYFVWNFEEKMSTGPGRRVSRQDIQLVQNLIERCLQLYMTQREVVDTLLVQAKIEPGFTELVWQKLEEENREFFQAYYLRLMVKQQIMEFNKLLEQQVRLMDQIQSTGVSSISNSNGPQMPLMPQNSSCYALENTGSALKQEGMHHPMGSSLPNVFTNGSSSLHAGIHGHIDLPTNASRIDAQPGMLSTQNSNMGLMQGINGKMIKPEAGYSASSSYMFGAESNVLEARPTIGDTSFSTVESSTQPMNEPLLDADISSFGFLGQIPRNFSLSDLTADFSQSSDILESYPRSPFLATDNETFLDSREREHQGENRRLDTISEGLSYEGFRNGQH